jgi:hypothetical protein
LVITNLVIGGDPQCAGDFRRGDTDLGKWPRALVELLVSCLACGHAELLREFLSLPWFDRSHLLVIFYLFPPGRATETDKPQIRMLPPPTNIDIADLSTVYPFLSTAVPTFGERMGSRA